MASLSRRAGFNLELFATKDSLWIEFCSPSIAAHHQEQKNDIIGILAPLEACAKSGDSRTCAEIHHKLWRDGLLDQFSDALISMYSRCGELAKVKKLVYTLGSVDIFSWNALIANFVRTGHHQNALFYYDMMQHHGLIPNSTTFACVLKSCSSQQALTKGEEVHENIVKQGLLKSNVVLGNALVTMYVKCGAVAKAQQVFEHLPVKNVVSWNALIACYVEKGKSELSIHCFNQMQSEGVRPSPVTFACILKACGNLQALDKGKIIHEEISKQGLLDKDTVLVTALIGMYAKCGAFGKARMLLDEFCFRDAIAWTTLITGYTNHGKFSEALNCFELMKVEGLHPDVYSWTSVIAGYTERDENMQALHCFEQMRCSGILPDAATYSCVLKACGNIGASSKGEELHNEISKQGHLKESVILGTALIDMYARCGILRKAKEVLEEISARDVVSWTAFITGLMQHGRINEALNCFYKMQDEGLSPDSVTFSSLITAYGLSGAVEDAQICFQNMLSKYGIMPDLRHYTGMVGVFGHLGQLDEAFQVANNLVPSDTKLCTVLLSACKKLGGDSCWSTFFNQDVQAE